MKNKCVLFFGAMRNIEYLDKNKTIKKKKTLDENHFTQLG